MATSATVILNRFSYPKVPGDQLWSVIDVTGPASYTPVTPGTPGPPATPPTGGQTVTAQDFGLQALDMVIAMGSADGLFSGVIIPLGGSLVTNQELTPGDDFVSVILKWVTATGAEASGNLSASRLRVMGIGR